MEEVVAAEELLAFKRQRVADNTETTPQVELVSFEWLLSEEQFNEEVRPFMIPRLLRDPHVRGLPWLLWRLSESGTFDPDTIGWDRRVLDVDTVETMAVRCFLPFPYLKQLFPRENVTKQQWAKAQMPWKLTRRTITRRLLTCLAELRTARVRDSEFAESHANSVLAKNVEQFTIACIGIRARILLELLGEEVFLQKLTAALSLKNWDILYLRLRKLAMYYSSPRRRYGQPLRLTSLPSGWGEVLEGIPGSPPQAEVEEAIPMTEAEAVPFAPARFECPPIDPEVLNEVRMKM